MNESCVISVVYAEAKACVCIVILPKMADVTQGRRMVEWVVICVFFAQRKPKVLSSHRKTEVEPLMSHGLFYRCTYYVSGPGNISVALLSMEGQKALRFNQKYLNVCFLDERRSYGFGTTWSWVINDILFILGWTVLLRWNISQQVHHFQSHRFQEKSPNFSYANSQKFNLTTNVVIFKNLLQNV